MGGSDPAGLTLKALTALDDLEDDFTASVVLGRGFVHEDALANWLASSRREYDIRRDVTDMAELMCQADLAIASFGVTAYELAAMGVPAIHLCLTEDHVESASVFAAPGAAVNMRPCKDVEIGDLGTQIRRLLHDGSHRHDMAGRAREFVDGSGARRTAKTIVGALCTVERTAEMWAECAH